MTRTVVLEQERPTHRMVADIDEDSVTIRGEIPDPDAEEGWTQEYDGAVLVTVSLGALLVLLDEVAWNSAERPMPQKFRCGWCHQAAGGGQDAFIALPSMTDDEIKAHTLVCESNPLVRSIKLLTEVARAAKASRAAISDEQSARDCYAACNLLDDLLKGLPL